MTPPRKPSATDPAKIPAEIVKCDRCKVWQEKQECFGSERTIVMVDVCAEHDEAFRHGRLPSQQGQ